MNKRSKPKSRARDYRSELRAEQAAATRERILEAVGARLRAGDRELAYTAIAREARVSVPTVYRHFPTRQDLFTALHLRLEPPGGTDVAALLDPGALSASVHTLFRRFSDPDDPRAQAGRLNVMWELSRATSVPSRRSLVNQLVDRRVPGLAEPWRTWIVDLGVVLVSSASLEAFRGYLDLSGDEAADRVMFALEALLSHAETLARPPEVR